MKVRGLHGSYHVEAVSFAEGGTAELFWCSQGNLVFKRYRKPRADPAERSRLAHLCTIGRRLLVDGGQASGSTPEASVNWPVDLVEEASTGRLLGVVIPRIPARFLQTDGTARLLSFLIYARANPPDAGIRVPVLIRLAEILAWLDAGRLVHGDVSMKNVVWCGAPIPGAYLIDCDSLHSQNPPPREGVSTEGWTDPRLAERRIPAHDQYSDRYALALAVYRGLTLNPGHLGRMPNGVWSTPSEFPARLHPAIRAALERSLDRPLDAERRVPPRDWVDLLVSSFVLKGKCDVARLEVLDHHAEVHRQREREKAARGGVISARPGVVRLPPPPHPAPPRTATPAFTPPAWGSGTGPAARHGSRPRIGAWLTCLAVAAALSWGGHVLYDHLTIPPATQAPSGVAAVQATLRQPTACVFVVDAAVEIIVAPNTHCDEGTTDTVKGTHGTNLGPFRVSNSDQVTADTVGCSLTRPTDGHRAWLVHRAHADEAASLCSQLTSIGWQ